MSALDYKWTDDCIEQLKRLRRQGLSNTEIAKIFGGNTTRSAVAGKVHRLKLPYREPSKAIFTPRPRDGRWA